jgi:hypothetical protein
MPRRPFNQMITTLSCLQRRFALKTNVFQLNVSVQELYRPAQRPRQPGRLPSDKTLADLTRFYEIDSELSSLDLCVNVHL